MKNNLYKMLVMLIVFGLAACQAAPTQAPAVDFFKDQPARWISVSPPKGWVAKLGPGTSTPSVIVTDDWEGYHTTNTRAVGIIITPLSDIGPADQVLKTVSGRMTSMLTEPITKVKKEQIDGQSYASVEYYGKSAEKNDTPAYYFLAVITTDQRSVLVFSSVNLDQVEKVRPAFQSTFKAVTLH